MKRGRPVQSQVRQNLVELLYFLGEGYAYDLYKNYRDIFPTITMRSIYYHLKKGLVTQEFKIKKIQKEMGDYSWGTQAEKIYYELGPKATPTVDPKVKEYLDGKK